MYKVYNRICKNCSDKLVYKGYNSWYESEKKNSLCKKCSYEKRKLNNPRKEEVKKYYYLGLNNRQIAKKIGINHGTVAYYLHSLNLISNWDKRYPPIDKIDKNNARCSKCKKIKPLKQFLYGRKGQKYEYRFSYCTVCRKRQLYLNLNSDIKKFLSDRWHRCKNRATKLKIAFNITKNEFIQIYFDQQGKCFYTNDELIWQVGKGKNYNYALSIDKIIPEKGYIKENIVFCTNRVNTAKNNFSLKEIKMWMPKWYKRIYEKFRYRMWDT